MHIPKGNLGDGGTYQHLLTNPALRAGIEQLQRYRTVMPTVGIHPLEGVPGGKAIVDQVDLRKQPTFSEAHERNFDVHCVLAGSKRFGYVRVGSSGLVVRKAYDPDKDVTIYGLPSHHMVASLFIGDFVVVSTKYVHIPNIRCADESALVVVLKIPAEQVSEFND